MKEWQNHLCLRQHYKQCDSSTTFHRILGPPDSTTLVGKHVGGGDGVMLIDAIYTFLPVTPPKFNMESILLYDRIQVRKITH